MSGCQGLQGGGSEYRASLGDEKTLGSESGDDYTTL